MSVDNTSFDKHIYWKYVVREIWEGGSLGDSKVEREMIANGTRIIGEMRQEHSHVATMLNALERQLAIFDAGEPPDYDIILGSIAYCRDYLSRCLGPREELIFDRLRGCDPISAKAIDDLEENHHDLVHRAYSLMAAIEAILGGGVMPREALDRVARDFVHAFRQHLNVEERLYFPVAIACLASNDRGDLDRHFFDKMDRIFDAAARENMGGLYERISAWDKAERTAQRALPEEHGGQS
ncbi:MAG: hemerythrin domain-containing protein [Stellaceae bacterium]